MKPRKATRKAVGKEQVCESSEWLFLIVFPLHTLKYKNQRSEVAIEARLLADSGPWTHRRENSVT